MTAYMQNYGITKTFIKDHLNDIDDKKTIEWIGDYDGKNANIQVSTDNNGLKKNYNIFLDNDDILNLLKIQPINVPLEQRLHNDFLNNKSMFLDGIFTQKQKRHRSRHRHESNHHKSKHYKSRHYKTRHHRTKKTHKH